MTEMRNAPSLPTRGATLTEATDTESIAQLGQLAPVGVIPKPPRLLLSALLWSAPSAILAADIGPDDLDHPHRVILEATQACARRGATGPAVVSDELLRTGSLSDAVRIELSEAAVAGGQPAAVGEYVAAVLSARLRAVAESMGSGLIGLAGTGAEAEIWHSALEFGRQLRAVAERLSAARGGEL